MLGERLGCFPHHLTGENIADSVHHHFRLFVPCLLYTSWRKDCTNIRYLAEATPDTADYINGLLRMHAVDAVSYTHLDVYKRQLI